MNPRQEVIRNYAAWTATAALRSGKHIKDGKTLQKALERVVNLNEIPETEMEFDVWHQKIVKRLQTSALKLAKDAKKTNLEFSIGWSAKLLNIYLKTLFYVGDTSPLTLRKIIHPPIDNILIDQINNCYGVDVWGEKSSVTIQGIQDYKQYARIIENIKLIAKEERFKNLLDIEHVWTSIEKKSTQKEKYHLHDAMVIALEAMPNHTGTFAEIANYINKQKSYTQKNGKEVPAYQIKMRATMSQGKYRQMFIHVNHDKLILIK